VIPLTARLEHYLEIRRGFGFDLSTSERVLRRFTEFAAAQGAEHITAALFLRWRESFGSADNNTWSARLGMVRGFAAWLQSVDPRTEVPPSGLAPREGAPCAALHLHSRGDGIHCQGGGPASLRLRAAGLDLCHLVRTDRRHRSAHP
jgi:hypothetical protein